MTENLNSTENYELESIFNSLRNGIIAINMKGIITFMNTPALQMAMTTKQKAIGKFLTDAVSPGGLLKVIQTGRGHTEKYQAGNRTYVTHRTAIYEDGKLVGAVGEFQDVSDIDFISNELDSVKLLVKELDIISSNSSDGICITDIKGNIIRMNKIFEEQFFEKMNEEQKSDFHKSIMSALNRGEVVSNFENQFFNEDTKGTAVLVENGRRLVEHVIVFLKDSSKINKLKKKLDKTNALISNIEKDRGDKVFIANSEVMKTILSKVEQLAKIDVPVLIQGEAGVGKKTIAELIVQSSSRNGKPFLKIDCSQYDSKQLMKKIFGYVNKDSEEHEEIAHKGLIEYANGGTLLLSRCETLSNEVQNELLRVLEEQTVRKVASEFYETIDVRILITTGNEFDYHVQNKDISKEFNNRVSSLKLSIPSLKDRQEEISELVQVYSNELNKKYGHEITFTNQALEYLTTLNWPGNIKELIFTLEKVHIISNKFEITKENLINIMSFNGDDLYDKSKAIIINKVLPLKEAVELLEKDLIKKVSETEKSYRDIARVLEVNASTIARKINKSNIG